jgi:glyceraldehyde-3-phosphate dehydrogenase (NADP+)
VKAPERVEREPVAERLESGEGGTVELRSPYSDVIVGRIARASERQVSEAIGAAVEAFETTRRLPSWQRAAVLEAVSSGITAEREHFARTIALEAGKPIRTARQEVERAAFTFGVAAEETKRIGGEIVPLDWLPGQERSVAHVRRVPLGPIAGITPFNFPLNLVAHKVAPALAAGNPILVRPASQTPTAALDLATLIVDAGWPEGGIAALPSTTEAARPLVEDERVRMLSFTGSPAVGWALKERAGRKRVTLELGGNAAVIVHADADAEEAAHRVAWGGFVFAGQTCISVQRVYVHDDVYERFTETLLEAVAALSVGDPLDEETDVGPVIDSAAAERIEEWLAEAVAGGATVLAGGTRQGTLWQPTVVEGLQRHMRLSCAEAFAPIVGLQRYAQIEEALAAAAATEFGLQAGLFTNDIRVVDAAFDRIEVGGLIVNDVSTYRVDHMPYGGVKSSGTGREGIRYAIEEMTELKLLVFRGAAEP